MSEITYKIKKLAFEFLKFKCDKCGSEIIEHDVTYYTSQTNAFVCKCGKVYSSTLSMDFGIIPFEVKELHRRRF